MKIGVYHAEWVGFGELTSTIYPFATIERKPQKLVLLGEMGSITEKEVVQYNGKLHEVRKCKKKKHYISVV